MLKIFNVTVFCMVFELLAFCPTALALEAETADWQSLFQGGVEKFSSKDYDASLELLKQALAQAKKGGNNKQVAKSLTALADLYRVTKKPLQAEPLYRECLAIHEKERASYEAALDRNALAGVMKDVNQFGDAEKLYRQAAGILEKAKGKNDPSVAMVSANLAVLQSRQGKYAEAIKTAEKALAIYVGYDAQSLDAAQTFFELGTYELDSKQLQRACEHLEAAHKIFAKKLPADDLRTAECVDALGTACYGIAAFAKAEQYGKAALVVFEKKLPADDLKIAALNANIGHRILRQKRADEALPYFEKSIAMQKKKLGKDHIDTTINLLGMAEAYAIKRQLPNCEKVLNRILEVKESTYGASNVEIIPCLINLAHCMDIQPARKGEALAFTQRADGIRASLSPEQKKQVERLIRQEVIPELSPEVFGARGARGF